jgi:3-deoxy-D-manno-octulosonate 8-phosphate phosphatase (KDO 8-P phosphatase)
LRQAGVEVAVVTAGQDGESVSARMRRLGINAFYEGDVSKSFALKDLRERYNLEWHEMGYLGDDWVDIIPLKLVGLPMAVANARPEAKALARYVTSASGGQGAVREVADWLLTLRGQYDDILTRWNTTT